MPQCSPISWACVLKPWWISVTLGSRNEGDKNPIWFTLGMGEVLKGWDKGLKDMCTGERRKLTVPPSLAYGKEGKGDMRCLDATNLLLLLCSATFWLWPFFFQAKSLRAARWFLTLSSWTSKMGPGHMIPLKKWIWMMTGNSPRMRSGILGLNFPNWCVE